MTRRMGMIVLSAMIIVLSSSWGLAFDLELSPTLWPKLFDLLARPISAGVAGISTFVHMTIVPITFPLGGLTSLSKFS
jgi:hypothetical protein